SASPGGSSVDQSAEDARGDNQAPSNAESPNHVTLKRRKTLIDAVEPPLKAPKGVANRIDRMLGGRRAHGVKDDSCYANGSASGAAARATTPGARRRPWRSRCRARWRR